jgi:hypothetical protein
MTATAVAASLRVLHDEGSSQLVCAGAQVDAPSTQADPELVRALLAPCNLHLPEAEAAKKELAELPFKGGDTADLTGLVAALHGNVLAVRPSPYACACDISYNIWREC